MLVENFPHRFSTRNAVYYSRRTSLDVRTTRDVVSCTYYCHHTVNICDYCSSLMRHARNYEPMISGIQLTVLLGEARLDWLIKLRWFVSRHCCLIHYSSLASVVPFLGFSRETTVFCAHFTPVQVYNFLVKLYIFPI